jgi:hypothetical protein
VPAGARPAKNAALWSGIFFGDAPGVRNCFRAFLGGLHETRISYQCGLEIKTRSVIFRQKLSALAKKWHLNYQEINGNRLFRPKSDWHGNCSMESTDNPVAV